MKRILAKLQAHRAAIARDAVALAGVAAIVVGLYQAYAPAAWIFGGAVGLAWSFAAQAQELFETKKNRKQGG